MRYSVHRHEIRSENAAQGMRRPSRYLVSWLRSNVQVEQALDYGCGKLRYASHLRTRAAALTCVDSDVQLSREQQIGGSYTSVEGYVERHWTNARTVTVSDFASDPHRYDFVLCANVLSAIPSAKVRARLLQRLRSALRPDGRALFVCQYRNGSFAAVLRSGRATPHLDGWLLEGLRGWAYYGILNKPKLVQLATRAGFAIQKAWTHGDTAYVLAGG
jgi:2-polyprenyl-3-methyl-5-hydroxy-6-metoxy-1,4-benzoquinol methylase